MASSGDYQNVAYNDDTKIEHLLKNIARECELSDDFAEKCTTIFATEAIKISTFGELLDRSKKLGAKRVMRKVQEKIEFPLPAEQEFLKIVNKYLLKEKNKKFMNFILFLSLLSAISFTVYWRDEIIQFIKHPNNLMIVGFVVLILFLIFLWKIVIPLINWTFVTNLTIIILLIAIIWILQNTPTETKNTTFNIDPELKELMKRIDTNQQTNYIKMKDKLDSVLKLVESISSQHLSMQNLLKNISSRLDKLETLIPSSIDEKSLSTKISSQLANFTCKQVEDFKIITEKNEKILSKINTQEIRSEHQPYLWDAMLTKEYVDLVSNWTSGKKPKALLYKATRDGFDNSIFHQKCNGKGQTITFIKAGNGYLFGGYASTSWGVANPWSTDNNAFIFTISNPNKIPPTKYEIKNPIHALKDMATRGPSFGDDITVMVDGKTVQFGFPMAYKDTTNEKLSTFTGHPTSTIGEIEVFTIG